MDTVIEIGLKDKIMFEEQVNTIIGKYEGIEITFLKENNFVSFFDDESVDDIIFKLEELNATKRIKRSGFILSFLGTKFHKYKELHHKVFVNQEILKNSNIFLMLSNYNAKTMVIVDNIIKEYIERGYNDFYYDK